MRVSIALKVFAHLVNKNVRKVIMYTNTMLFSESQIVISAHMIDGWSNGLVLKSKNESLQILMDPIIIK